MRGLFGRSKCEPLFGATRFAVAIIGVAVVSVIVMMTQISTAQTTVAAAQADLASEGRAPRPTPQGVGPFQAFSFGMFGALGMFLFLLDKEDINCFKRAKATFRFSDAQVFIAADGSLQIVAPHRDYKVFIYRIGISIFLGGFVAMLFATEGTWREAVLLGCVWNSVLTRLAERRGDNPIMEGAGT